jgi:mycothiol synthase
MTVRAARREDFDAVLAVEIAADLDDFGEMDVTAEDLAEEWDERPGFDVERDAWVGLDDADRVVGYGEVWERYEGEPWVHGSVHPGHRGRGLGDALLERAEARARELEGRLLVSHVRGPDPAGAALHERRGFAYARSILRMSIELAAAPESPAWPAGLERLPFDPDRHDRVVHDAVEEAFAEEYGHEPEEHGRWRSRLIELPGFDPALWIVVWNGHEVAGCSLARLYSDGAWIGALAVRPAWRRLGLGRALLRETFHEAWAHGRTRVALGVDSRNPTGATRLYEAVGMRERFRFDRYEKRLAQTA